MPEKFIVPQFIDNEDKILGPITVRQFLICLVATFILFILYKLLPTAYFIFWAIIVAGLAGTFGFLKINGQVFHLFFINVIQSLSRPRLRVWNKTLNDTELRRYMQRVEEPKAPAVIKKAKPSSTRLRDLSLTVNTGGVYNPDEDL